MSIYLVQQQREVRIQLFDLIWSGNEMFRTESYIPPFAVYCLPFTLLW